MGKLHTLRRAIQRDPEQWVAGRSMNGRIYGIHGAHWSRRNKRFEPWYETSYQKFVRKTLRDIGYEV